MKRKTRAEEKLINSQHQNRVMPSIASFGIWLILALFLSGLASLASPRSSAQDRSPAVPKTPPSPVYSESVPYTPVPEPTPQKGKKPRPPKPFRFPKKPSNYVPDPMVEFPVIVADVAGKAVRGLSAADFKVYVDGFEQEVVSSADDRPLNVILMVDTSASTGYVFEGIRDFLKRELPLFRPEDKIKIVRLSTDAKVVAESLNDTKQLEKSLRKLEPGDGTSVYDGIGSVVEKSLGTGQGTPTVVMITDGVDTTSLRYDRAGALSMAWSTWDAFVVLYVNTWTDVPAVSPIAMLGAGGAIGVFRPPGSTKAEYAAGKNFLVDLYTSTGGMGLELDPRSAAPINLADFLRSRYTLTIKRPSVTPGQNHNIKVRVARPNLVVISKSVLLD